MSFFQHIRISAWWFKLPPFLMLLYLYFIEENIYDFYQQISLILFLSAGLIIIAVFASFINNYYDQEDDLKAGKENKMINLGKKQQFAVLGISVVAGIFYSFFLIQNLYALTFYWLSWFCFYIYSNKKTRLKEKTYLGVIFDGLGSQFFPVLFLFSFLYIKNFENHLVSIISGTIWMTFSFGMRSLIIHQYYDYENDIKSGVRTFVNNTVPLSRDIFQGFVLTVEVVSFIVFIWSVDLQIFIIPILIYILLLFVLKTFNVKFYFFNPSQNQKSRSFFFDFYITILPITLLGLLTLKNSQNGILLIVSIILFNVPTLFKAINFFKLKIIR